MLEVGRVALAIAEQHDKRLLWGVSWRSSTQRTGNRLKGGVERAHTNPVVRKLWERYASACDIVPMTSLPEASKMFASFTPIEL